ncbi:MAG TPA: carboxypeptidase-like regulatory domain-containing protein [Polyangia bacterium]|jgi:protocatechuate 3,4-dioxygenase beta subunit
MRPLALALLVIATTVGACHREAGNQIAPALATAGVDPRDVRCVERPEGCIFCDGRGTVLPLLEPDEAPSALCDPKDPAVCVEFCSRLAPDCATSWFRGATCILSSEEEFRREIFRRDTSDKPEVLLQGRVTDDAGRRIEGAKIRAWFQGTAIADETTVKDGSFRLRLPAAVVPYTLRIAHAGLATEIADVRLDRSPTVTRSFRLAPDVTQKGRVVDASGAPVRGADVRALRAPDDVVEVASAQTNDDGQFALTGLETRKYNIVASRFGWLPGTIRTTGVPGAPRVTIRLSRTGVIKGSVIDGEGDAVAHAVVIAMPSGAFGVGSSPIIWTTDTDGKFAQDRFRPGTYYLWARHGEMLVYPPEKIEVGESSADAEIELGVTHRGARVRGRVAQSSVLPLDPETRAVLVGRSPLAFPRKAVGELDKGGNFVIPGVLPGRYEISVRVGPRVLSITGGPREIEVPIEEGATVDLPEPVVVRPRPAE